ncbi:MAG: hypothetical protein V3V10_09470, partial [Planctomycetota bacterium]
MAEVDQDLFAGLEVKGQIIGDSRPIEQQKKVAPIDQDLFAGLQVGDSIIGGVQDIPKPGLVPVQVETLQAEEQQAADIDRRREFFKTQRRPQTT